MVDLKRSHLRWWMVPGAVTFLLLFFNSPWVRVHYPEVYRAKRWVYGLHLEMNFAVWWSAILFLLSAALFYEAASRERRSLRRAYLELSLLMLAIVIDEVGSLHERISGFGGWPSLAPFGLLMLALLVDSLRLLWRERDTRAVACLALVGSVTLVSVAWQEYAEHNLTSKQWSEWWGRFIEEATELAGALLILAAAVHARWRRWGAPAMAAVPDPTRMAKLLPIVVIGFLGHVASAQVLYLPKTGPSRWYGSPAAVYPLAVFLILACYALWVPRQGPDDHRQPPEVRAFWNVVAVFFFACSLGFVQNLWGLFGRVVPGLGRRSFYEPRLLWIALILMAWVIGWSLRRQLGRRGLLLLALPLAPVVHVQLEHLAAKHLAAGLFALLCAVALLRSSEPAPTGRVAIDQADPN